MRKFFLFLKQTLFDSTAASITLYKIMIPALIVIKVLEELGGIALLSKWLYPVMSWVGLPGELGIVWATTLFVNIYAGLVVLASMDAAFTVAQISTLGGMMLVSHALLVEGAIARGAGVPFVISVVERVACSLLFGWLLCHAYAWLGAGVQVADPLLISGEEKLTLMGWVILQIKNLTIIFVIINALMLLLKTIKVLNGEALIAYLLNPVLKLLGMSKEAANLTLVGMTLGLTYGGGLLIAEAQKGIIKKQDVVTAILLLNLLHSLIEDTLLILMMGADFIPVFFGRIVFSLLIVAVLAVGVRKIFSTAP